MNEFTAMVWLFTLLAFYIVIKYGIPIALIIVGYFILKGYKKRKIVAMSDKPTFVNKQGNIKP
ncbi:MULTISPECIES: hypothetical protein [unclassified Paenibacillus]|uniref:hypothetical protein n=1 Tax=unclassified Paenibacillus TaxID=185978 RepID=UPI00040CBD64|nr:MULTISPECIES: hypothetical protein [unclassified Paenibacillus]KGP77691.1 hypothetical protein P364_0131955 [Paenibacillus sp. MAEPY2]KGP78690.1 hypothetical protein P363_0131965 [Paenibacillus sp. MAEPY1]OZQ62804.1 hypothetical protein CA599_25415 [Paenibacillus taichungensis]